MLLGGFITDRERQATWQGTRLHVLRVDGGAKLRRTGRMHEVPGSQGPTRQSKLGYHGNVTVLLIIGGAHEPLAPIH